MLLDKFSNFYKKFEKYISPIGLIYGFIFTTLTLTRVDMFIENFWVVLHLLLAAGGILTLTLYENRAEEKKISQENREKFHFFLTLIIQFAFGGLFSTFFVFYMPSASLVESWISLLFLVILLVGNELWKKHYKRLAFQVSTLFVSIYLFLIFLLPVLFHRLGSDLFIAAGLISMMIVAIFLALLKRFAREKFKNDHNLIRFLVIGIFVLLNVLYFTDIIPPIPLSIKSSGVYHSITKNSAGNYVAQNEPSTWADYFNRYPAFHRQVGENIYAFSAVFSPVNFATEIVHQWQYYDEIKKTWIDSSRTVLPIIGGRDGGFRTYSIKSAVPAGLWRVKVMTPPGQTIGRINFEVVEATSTPELISNIL